MAEKLQMRLYALFAVLKDGRRQWFDGWDEEGDPHWLPGYRSEDGFKDAKHFTTTKDGWDECEKIQAKFKQRIQIKMASVPCTVTLTVDEVTCTNGY